MGCGASAVKPEEPSAPASEPEPVVPPQEAQEKTPPAAAKEEKTPLKDGAKKDVTDPKHRSTKLAENASLRGKNIFSNLAKIESDKNIRTFYELHTGKRGRDEVLGSGMSGAVKQIKRKSDGKMFAMKAIKMNNMDPETTEELINEISLLKSMDHPHISRLYEAFEERDFCVRLVMELCSGGELFDRLMEKSHFGEKECASLLLQMLSALEDVIISS